MYTNNVISVDAIMVGRGRRDVCKAAGGGDGKGDNAREDLMMMTT
jgi:hypothetical protein